MVLLQLFLGMALGFAGINVMIGAGGLCLVGILACFASLVLLIKAMTRSIHWLAALRRTAPYSGSSSHIPRDAGIRS